jgi:D-xylose reductase
VLAWIALIDPLLRVPIQVAIKDSKLSRDEMFLVCKLWNTFHSMKAVNLALHATLDNLMLEYLDIYYINWPMGFKVYYT